MSICHIVKEIQKSKTVVEIVLKCGIDGLVQRNLEQNQSYLRDLRHIISLAALKKLSTTEMSAILKKKISTLTITCFDFMKYVELSEKPTLMINTKRYEEKLLK